MRACVFAFVVLLCGSVPRVVEAQGQSSDAGWISVRVPGGTAALMKAAGLDPATPRAQVLWTLIRSLHSFPPGLEPAADRRRVSVFTYLQQMAELEHLASPDDRVPSPLPESDWKRLLGMARDAPSAVVAAMLKDRPASLLFVGLSATDAATRFYLAARPDLLEAIYRTPRVAALAAHGRSLRIRNGLVEVPGGSDAVILWEDLVGESATSPDRFFLALCGKHDGQLARLYDAVDHLDAAGQAFVLGRQLGNPADRISRFRALYAASRIANPVGNPIDHPFTHSLYDAAHVLAMLRFAPDGRPAIPPWRKFWVAAFASDELPSTPRYDVESIEFDGLLDAADLVELICVANVAERRERAEMWLFAQRVFANAPMSTLADVLVALRGRQRFSALVLTLERMGVTDPFVYAKALTRAQRVTDIGGTTTAATAQALFQGSLVMIERARLGRAIGAEVASRLVESLSTVPMTNDGEPLGSVAEWIVLVFFSALKPPIVASDTQNADRLLEQHAIRAFAGLTRDARPEVPGVVEIEGLKYRVDPAAADAAKWSVVRAAQGGVTLDQVLAFARAARKLTDSISDVSQLAARLSALTETAKPLLEHEPRASTAAGVPPRLRRLMDDTMTRGARIKKSEDLKALPDIARPLMRASDFFLAEVLVALAYAPHLGDPGGKAMLAGDPSPLHDWGLGERLDNARARAPWRVPGAARDTAGVWRVSGSLMALDVGLGDLALRRVFTESLPEPPTISANDRAAFTEGVSLANTFDYLDADQEGLVDAIQRGRDRLAAIRSNPSVLADLLNDAGVRDVRREMIPWTLAHEPDRLPDFFAYGDLLRLGRMRPASIAKLDAWGTSGAAREGCLCLMFPATGEWETMAGRRGKSLVASLMPDLALMIAETLRDRHLPAMLTRSMLEAATQDFMDDVRLAFEDDWISMFRQVRKTLPPRMDDYIASLTTHGPLVPIR